MKRLYILLLAMSCLVLAQEVDRDMIKRSGEYYYGTATAMNENEARDKALKDLTGQIAVRVASSFEQKLQESGTSIQENVESVLKTHSQATLRNVKSDVRPTRGGMVEVFCYLQKSEVEKIFSERRKLIAEMTEKAQDYANEGNYAYALKLYYFASILINSLPDQSVVFEDVNYTTLIPEQVNKIFLNTRFAFDRDDMISDKEREVTLEVTNNGRAVSLLDFTFWSGSSQVAVQARDGYATFRLLGSSVDFRDLKMNIKYAYYESRNEYNVVADLWDLVNRPIFKSNKTVKLKRLPGKQGPLREATAPAADKTGRSPKMASAGSTSATGFDLNLKYDGDVSIASRIVKEAEKFLDVMSRRDYKAMKANYGSDRFLLRKIANYLKFNQPKVLEKKLNASLNKTESGWELRRVRMLHNYPTIRKESTEFLVLDFNEEGKLQDLNVSITENLYRRFVEEAEYGKDWGNRQEIIKFVEKYRTAYITRDIETVEMMFAEEALIIVGREIKRKKLPRDLVKYQKLGNQPDYEYIKLTKQDYIGRQRRVFKSQADLSLDFATFNMIKKNNAPNVYGIEMRQHYTSTSYADEGYLFLLIDFSERDPLIYVRAWQPNEWSEEQLIRTANFKIYK